MFICKPSPKPWMKIARREIGVEEIPGFRHNERILDYHSTTSKLTSDDETPWCSGFVNWCMLDAGYKGTGSPAARSWNSWGKKLDKPRYGCVAVFWRGTIDGWQGHVGFYIAHDNDHVIVLGGNQNNKVCYRGYPLNQLLGYRWPTDKEKRDAGK